VTPGLVIRRLSTTISCLLEYIMPSVSRASFTCADRCMLSRLFTCKSIGIKLVFSFLGLGGLLHATSTTPTLLDYDLNDRLCRFHFSNR
jgi:hypothetical protein